MCVCMLDTINTVLPIHKQCDFLTQNINSGINIFTKAIKAKKDIVQYCQMSYLNNDMVSVDARSVHVMCPSDPVPCG